jgi:hypothetical protein
MIIALEDLYIGLLVLAGLSIAAVAVVVLYSLFKGQR